MAQNGKKSGLPEVGAIYEFENYRFEPGVERLERANITLHLPPKEMCLLALLVKNHGRLVKHRIIWDTVWPGQDVSYESLTRCVYSLRRALGKGSSKIIRSVPRQGYMFTASTKTIVPKLKVNSVIEKSIQTVPAAYSLYQLGLHQASTPSLLHQQRAITFFTRANQIDPHYTVPLGALAETSMYQSIRGYLSPDDAALQASNAINLALQTDPDLVSALAAKGWFEAAYYGRIESAFEYFDYALRIDPDHAMTYFARAWIERSTGQLQQALTTLTRGSEIDPLHLNVAHALTFTLFYCGRPEEALEMERAYTRDLPEIDNGHFYRAIFASWLGHHNEAIDAAKSGIKLSPKDPSGLAILSYTLARGGFIDKAQQLANRARAITEPRPIPLFLAASYLALGEERIALSVLQEARDQKAPTLPQAAFDPCLESLRGRPEFGAVFDSE